MDWLAADRIDPRAKEDNQSFYQSAAPEEMQKEIQSTAEKDALVLNARERLQKLGEAPKDRLNPR